MRLWSVHPYYLDAKGLVALWREGLLAQKVLQGHTKGYKNHPQLTRFKNTKNPVAAIAAYLGFVVDEAEIRGYHFDRNKITARQCTKKNYSHQRATGIRIRPLIGKAER
ncbi:MAG: pyrimidine dimer DNA glycosylase/endonuclease V [Nitrosomonas sp.]|uniref:pyrimidine dimer DNA glycosylase/endonuclease V n=1 Tax=Nitrosomonas sp. TaxID=42353 RepID=UPI0027342E84|nr:pyrimidine dimer DNA glycosylase/endonuclease V [Nitrosomonas sp.]MDP3663483.1 pyrimidine dimer DNA glycosylase/endonuclease V [Nitrosomonas sp.]MDZ4104764.1 pyrimidine dimer DNA glycosylase/endonuclease V [Nitrosomonas sp.]